MDNIDSINMTPSEKEEMERWANTIPQDVDEIEYLVPQPIGTSNLGSIGEYSTISNERPEARRVLHKRGPDGILRPVTTVRIT